MGNVRLTLMSEGRETAADFAAGTNLLQALQSFDGFDFDAPCGGAGTCGKCKVLADGEISAPSAAEREKLSQTQLEQGIRLACLCRVEGDARITPLFSAAGARIVTRRFEYSGEYDSPFELVSLSLPPPDLADQRSDSRRLADGLHERGVRTAGFSLADLRALPALLRRGEFAPSLLAVDSAVFGPAAGAEEPGVGIAVDIGTTTVVAYLIRLADGETLGVVSGLNLQKAWGGDVISRVQASNGEGPGPQSAAVRGQLERMILRLMEEAELSWSSLRGVTVAGNTVMMHLFAGIEPRAIAVSPFIPVFTERRTEASEELLPRLPVNVPLVLLPSISGFIGADITAGILATGLHEARRPTLLIDIGTNGEIVLGDSHRMLACSTAAGPAFEGATISRGVGGIPGAVNSVVFDSGKLEVTTIADAPAIGICGSGIIDLTAVLVAAGVVDEGGRLLPPDELPDGLDGALRERVREDGFLVTVGRDGDEIIFTPGDVREVQLAKASVAAGIYVLLEEYGIGPDGVDRVYLAGGFGSYIDTAGAVGIGLLPAELLDRITPAGNTAGAGAAQLLLSRTAFRRIEELTERVEYLELSASMRFQELYVDKMFFPAP